MPLTYFYLLFLWLKVSDLLVDEGILLELAWINLSELNYYS